MAAVMDAAYAAPGLYWGAEPNDLCLRVLNLLGPGVASRRLVDLGCGEGRDAVRFARAGMEVLAVDVSAVGLEKAARWAASEGVALRTARASILDFRLEEPVDVIYSSGTLHHLPAGLRAEVLRHYREWIRPGGIFAGNAFVERPDIPVPPDWTPEEHHYRPGELLGHFAGWEVLSASGFSFPCTSGGIPHRHAMDEVVARRLR